MAGNVIDGSHINTQIANDAQYMQDVYYWLKQRLNSWLTNAGNTTQLTGYGITATTDQNEILGLQIDMENLVSVFEGTATLSAGSGRNVLQDIALVRGVN